MDRFLSRTLILVVLVFAVAQPAFAGGWATVRLDEPPGPIVAGEQWRFGFVVKQHDRTPTNDVVPVMRAVHMVTGEELTVTGSQVGDVGHFEADVIFPAAGEWKWEIMPEPYAATSLESIIVLPSSSELMTDAEPGPEARMTAGGLRITFTIDIELNPAGGAMRAEPASGDAVEVTITDSGFVPSRIEIAPGTEVVWTNSSSLAHGVTSDSLAFRDSSLLDAGDEFRQEFSEAGTYRYWCGPHPNMTGMVVVTE